MKSTRAYSLLEIKGLDEQKRVIRGIASTPTPDRMNDIIELDGMVFKTPLPFLYQHNARQPIGRVTEAKKTKAGLEIVAEIAGDIAPFITEAWNLIKAGLVQGLSIGFRGIEEAFNKETGGFRFIKTELFEISAVTIPANVEASILSVKSADAIALAALGDRRSSVVRLDKNLPGVSGLTLTHSPRGSTTVKKTIQEQIAEFEVKRAATEARMTEIMSKSADEGRTLEAAESEEYDGLAAEVKQIDEHLVRLKAHEKQIVAKAQTAGSSAITQQTVNDPTTAAQVRSRGSEPITVRSNHAPGIGVARMAIARVQGVMYGESPVAIAKELWPDMPEVAQALSMRTKATVEAGDTTTSGWASQLIPAAQQMMNEFLELYRPATILGRIPGLRRVPFNVAVPIQTAGGSYTWVGEAVAKPVTSLTFDSVTLRWAKAAGIIVITQELAKFSSPSAEMIVRDDMVKGIARFIDQQFVSTTAEVTNVSPAGILNGISSTATSGTSSTSFRTDMNTLLNKLAVNNVDPTNVVILMSATQALALSLMVTDLGVRFFPDITVQGGTILGMPVIISQNVGTKIIALNVNDILLAEDGGVQIDVSTEASVEMSTTPIVGDTSPSTGAVLKSLWQNNLVGLRVEKFITWKRGRTAAVEYITNNAYVPS